MLIITGADTGFTNLILVLYRILFHNLGLTIIAVGILSRVIFLPSSISMIRSQRKMQELKPHLDAIKKKHKDDKRKQMEEQSKLFKEHGINPATGFLSALIQIVVSILLYYSLRSHILHDSSINPHFLAWNLAVPDVYHNVIGKLPIPGVLVLLSAIFQLALSKMMAPKKQIREEAKAVAKKEHKDKEQQQDFSDAAAQMQSQMLFLFPLMILYSGIVLQAGLAVYWLVTTLFAIAQQYILVGLGGLADWLPKSVVEKFDRV